MVYPTIDLIQKEIDAVHDTRKNIIAGLKQKESSLAHNLEEIRKQINILESVEIVLTYSGYVEDIPLAVVEEVPAIQETLFKTSSDEVIGINTSALSDEEFMDLYENGLSSSIFKDDDDGDDDVSDLATTLSEMSEEEFEAMLNRAS